MHFALSVKSNTSNVLRRLVDRDLPTTDVDLVPRCQCLGSAGRDIIDRRACIDDAYNGGDASPNHIVARASTDGHKPAT